MVLGLTSFSSILTFDLMLSIEKLGSTDCKNAAYNDFASEHTGTNSFVTVALNEDCAAVHAKTRELSGVSIDLYRSFFH